MTWYYWRRWRVALSKNRNDFIHDIDGIWERVIGDLYLLT